MKTPWLQPTKAIDGRTPNSRGCGRVTYHQATRDPQLACNLLFVHWRHQSPKSFSPLISRYKYNAAANMTHRMIGPKNAPNIKPNLRFDRKPIPEPIADKEKPHQTNVTNWLYSPHGNFEIVNSWAAIATIPTETRTKEIGNREIHPVASRVWLSSVVVSTPRSVNSYGFGFRTDLYGRTPRFTESTEVRSPLK